MATLTLPPETAISERATSVVRTEPMELRMDDETLRNTAAMVMAQGALIEHLLAVQMHDLPRDQAEEYAMQLAATLDVLGPSMKLPDKEAELFADLTVRAGVHLRASAIRAFAIAKGQRQDERA
ncbi:hypothetical protein FV228_01505 [Methylobacterium sp. WL18]|uniref:hypothetical protein n=1 Tax=Methylobacterium sp. WL18 TaxID=2603897 RepID=UPI0011C84E10|nr:hypothetical protein [Methylobacterium sp. WL18]TXN76066.1 hypothetical protein FV228_01505 [Methylobacterium sp. WL18]